MKKRLIGIGMITGLLFVAGGCSGTKQFVQQSESVHESTQKEAEASEAEKDNWKTEYTYSAEGNKLMITATYATPVVKQDGTVTVEGLDNTYTTTSLPFHSVKLMLPKDTKMAAVSAVWGDAMSLDNVTLGEKEYATTEENSRAGEYLAESEHGWNVSATTQVFEGVPVAYINLYPVAYDEQQKTLIYTNTVQVTISLEEEAWDLSKLEDMDYIKEMVDNPEFLDNLN